MGKRAEGGLELLPHPIQLRYSRVVSRAGLFESGSGSGLKLAETSVLVRA